jgi:hypothetical protein
MVHRNAPLSIEGRRRLIERCRTRPIAHVAAEMGISRAGASKWVNRYRELSRVSWSPVILFQADCGVASCCRHQLPSYSAGGT